LTVWLLAVLLCVVGGVTAVSIAFARRHTTNPMTIRAQTQNGAQLALRNPADPIRVSLRPDGVTVSADGIPGDLTVVPATDPPDSRRALREWRGLFESGLVVYATRRSVMHLSASNRARITALLDLGEVRIKGGTLRLRLRDPARVADARGPVFELSKYIAATPNKLVEDIASETNPGMQIVCLDLLAERGLAPALAEAARVISESSDPDVQAIAGVVLTGAPSEPDEIVRLARLAPFVVARTLSDDPASCRLLMQTGEAELMIATLPVLGGCGGVEDLAWMRELALRSDLGLAAGAGLRILRERLGQQGVAGRVTLTDERRAGEGALAPVEPGRLAIARRLGPGASEE
jgi:hypothetical protein